MLRNTLGTKAAVKIHQGVLHYPALQTWRQLGRVPGGQGMPSVGKSAGRDSPCHGQSRSNFGLFVCQPLGVRPRQEGVMSAGLSKAGMDHPAAPSWPWEKGCLAAHTCHVCSQH